MFGAAKPTQETPSQAETACRIYRSAFLDVLGVILVTDQHTSAEWHNAVAWGAAEGLFEIAGGENVDGHRVSIYRPGKLGGPSYDYWKARVDMANLRTLAMESGF